MNSATKSTSLSLHSLKPLAGARKASRRLGRGEGSGRGKTSGKGGKGQTARSGGHVRPGFEGGQMPLVRRLPKLGFRSRQKTFGTNQFDVVNVSTLEHFPAGATVDAHAIWAKGYGRTASKLAGVKVLGDGTLTKKLHVRVQAVTPSAKEKIEAAGGTVEIVLFPKEEPKEEAVS